MQELSRSGKWLSIRIFFIWIINELGYLEVYNMLRHRPGKIPDLWLPISCLQRATICPGYVSL